MKKTLLFMLCSLLCLSAFAGCDTHSDVTEQTTAQQAEQTTTEITTEAVNEPTTEQVTEEVTTEAIIYDPATLHAQAYILAEDTAHFKQHGRLISLTDGLGCDHVMSGLEFEGVMYGEVKLSLSVTADTYFAVWVDGVRNEQSLYATTDTTELVLADFDTAQLHHIRLLKQTEPQFSLSTLKSVTLTGELSDAPADKPLYIEVLGDSITSGYGNLGKPNSANPGGAEWHDGTQTYAALSIYALDADCSVISCSGIGANKGFPYFDMQQYYEKTSFFRDSTSATSDHVFGRVPDVVVINLGTNDNSQGATEQGFKDSVKQLITFIRTTYQKDVPIVWVHNMMGECRFDWADAVLQEMGGEQAGIYSVRMNANHNGTHGHPNLSGHRNASRRLTEKLKEILAAD